MPTDLPVRGRLALLLTAVSFVVLRWSRQTWPRLMPNVEAGLAARKAGPQSPHTPKITDKPAGYSYAVRKCQCYPAWYRPRLGS